VQVTCGSRDHGEPQVIFSEQIHRLDCQCRFEITFLVNLQ
jgi:hypothetical protein